MHTLARQCGVEYVLSKPCEPEIVLRTVNACLGKSSVAAPVVVPESFDREHLRLLTDSLSKVNLRLEALVQISLNLCSESLSSGLFEKFCKSARELNSAKRAIVTIESEDSSKVLELYSSGFDLNTGHILRTSRVGGAAFSTFIKDRQSLRIRNPEGDPRALGFPVEYPRFESFLAAPIASADQRYGWLLLFDRLGAPEFTEEDERLGGLMGALVGRILDKQDYTRLPGARLPSSNRRLPNAGVWKTPCATRKFGIACFLRRTCYLAGYSIDAPCVFWM